MMRHYAVSFIDESTERRDVRATVYVEAVTMAEAEEKAVGMFTSKLKKRYGNLPYTMQLISQDEFNTNFNAHESHPEIYQDEYYLKDNSKII